MKVIIKIDEKTVMTPIREFPNVTAAHIWFMGNFTFPVNAKITIEELPQKGYKVVYNEIFPRYMMVEAQSEKEAKDKVSAKLENLGMPSWQFVTVIEQK